MEPDHHESTPLVEDRMRSADDDCDTWRQEMDTSQITWKFRKTGTSKPAGLLPGIEPGKPRPSTAA